MPTVAAIAAYPRMAGSLSTAIRIPSEIVGSPPSIRISAAPTSAVLKKNTTKYWMR